MTIWYQFPSNRLLIDLSLWSADLTALGNEIHRIDPLVDLYHFDVSDAHFVPGLLFFPDLVAALRPLTDHPFHVHLMVDHPEALVQPFLAAGVELITVHVENGYAAELAVEKLKQAGKSAGIALKLETGIEDVIPYISTVDLVLLIGTPLGIKGQGLAPQATSRLQFIRQQIDNRGWAEQS